jgi:acyl-[acyl-carrier-protein]-phospholipid O-acyltransferase/long-chain-fatty-acid--[acyl-carrier-protein] ligase
MNSSQEIDAAPGSENKLPKKSKGLFTRGFVSLLGVSLFGAANDNILKQILTYMVALGGLWENWLGEGSVGYVSLVLALPFIFISGYAGQLADKYSKRDVIKWVKIAEIPIAILAICGLAFGSFWLSLFALFLLAVQSSFYGPAKFGIIPDVVETNQLSHANGLINAITNIAIILGALVAGPLTALYYPMMEEQPSVAVAPLDPSESSSVVATEDSASASGDSVRLVRDWSRESQSWPAGLTLLGVSLLGLIAALRMPKMKAVDPDLKFSSAILRPHIQTFKDANRPLLVVLFSWSGFYLIGQLALLLMADLRDPLGVSFEAMSYLIALLAISIGVGSCIVAYLSGKNIRPYFSLVGAIGMTVCFATMGIAQLNYTLLAILVFLVGVFAGFYIVPLQALLQYLSPSDERGRFFGTANALSFVFISAAGLIYIALSRLGMPPEKIPLVCAGLAAVGTFVGAIELNRITAAQKIAAEDK